MIMILHRMHALQCNATQDLRLHLTYTGQYYCLGDVPAPDFEIEIVEKWTKSVAPMGGETQPKFNVCLHVSACISLRAYSISF